MTSGSVYRRDRMTPPHVVLALPEGTGVVSARMDDLFDEDGGLRNDLAAIGPAGLRGLRAILNWPQERRDALLRSWVGRSEWAYLAQLVALADADNVSRLRLLRAIRDLRISEYKEGGDMTASKPFRPALRCPPRHSDHLSGT